MPCQPSLISPLNRYLNFKTTTKIILQTKKKRLYEVINTLIVLHKAANMIHRKSLSRSNNYDKKSRNIL